MNYEEALQFWGAKSPAQFEQWMQSDAMYDLCTPEGRERLPWPPFDPDQIISAFSVAADWDIPPKVIPIMGDFHDLVCLDLRNGEPVSVVVLDDDRNELARFSTWESFLAALQPSEDEPPGDLGVIEDQSWLNF